MQSRDIVENAAGHDSVQHALDTQDRPFGHRQPRRRHADRSPVAETAVRSRDMGDRIDMSLGEVMKEETNIVSQMTLGVPDKN